MRGRIVVVKEYGNPFEIEEYDVAEPERGAVILRMTQACICGSDLHIWCGDQTQEFMPLPPTGRSWDTRERGWWKPWAGGWPPTPWELP